MTAIALTVLPQGSMLVFSMQSQLTFPFLLKLESFIRCLTHGLGKYTTNHQHSGKVETLTDLNRITLATF